MSSLEAALRVLELYDRKGSADLKPCAMAAAEYLKQHFDSELAPLLADAEVVPDVVCNC